jgi:sn-glycerol 3-phosphate transport system permease protein
VTQLSIDNHSPLARIDTAERKPGRAHWLPAAALLAPSLVFLIAFTYWPVARVLAESFVTGRFAAAHALGIDNYRRLFADPHFARAAWNNAIYAAGTIVPSLVLALGFAIALREGTRLNALLRTMIVMPLLIPLVAAAALFTFLFLPGDGLVDFYLARFGFGMVNWFGDPDLALGSVIAVTVWKNTGYYMLFFLAGLAGLPQDLLDAATIDGAGSWRRFRAVTLPLLGPTFGFVVPIALLNALTQIDHVITVTQRRAVGRDQFVALLHLPAGGAELRHRSCLGGDRGQRRGIAKSIFDLVPQPRTRHSL